MPKRIKLRRFRRGEKKMLFTKLHDRKSPVWIAQRYRIMANVYQHQSVRAAARQLGCAKETAYRWVKEFNRQGFRCLERCSNPEGRPTQITQRQMNTWLGTAQKRPTDVGLPFTNWSMNTLHEYLVKRQNFPKVSPEWLRRLLHRGDVSWQHPKTGKQSHDPDFAAKKSVFWRFLRNVRSVAPWSAMISGVHWNSVQSQACAGRHRQTPATARHLHT
jgi:transposase